MNSKGISFPCSSWCKKPVLFPWFSTKAKTPLPKARNHLAFTERGDCILRRKSLETDVVDNEQTRSHRDAAARPETALGSICREIPVCSRDMALPLDMAYQDKHLTPCLCQSSMSLKVWWQI